MSIINSQPLIGSSGSAGYQIQRSVRLRASASAYLNRTPASSGDRQKWTWSAWVKRGQLGAAQAVLFSSGSNGAAGFYDAITIDSDKLTLALSNSSGSATDALLICTQVLRDPSAWYHIIISVDTTQSTSSNRVKIYINGNQVTAFSTSSYPSLNYYTSFFQTTVAHYHGCAANAYAGQRLFDGYITEVNFVNGLQLTPSEFGETNSITGVWQPKKYNGTYGTNGFYINFSDNSNNTATTIGKDYSGNGNNWTPNNISVTAGVTYDSMLDVPTLWADGGNGRGNYCTLSPILIGRVDGAGATYGTRDGNLTGGNTGSGGWAMVGSTMAIASGSGKYYFEARVGVAGQNMSVGVQKVNTPFAAPYIVGYTGDINGYSYTNDGLKWNNGSTAYGSAATAGDIIGVAVDASGGTSSIEFYKNGVSMGVAFTGITGDLMPALSSTAGSGIVNVTFGQRPFSYTPPSGFKALNTQNLPTPTILKGNQYFDATTYTGNGGTLAVVNSGAMQPDLVWLKTRNTVSSNLLYDSSRGVLNYLSSNQTAAEASLANSFTAFNSNGFSLGSDGNVNGNGTTYVGWQWKEGATQGFDIVTYTGTGVNRTVAHNLGVAPSMIIIKSRSGVRNWPVYNAYLTNPATAYLILNATSAQTTGDTTVWGSTAPTSSVFTVGTAGSTNNTSETYVAYLFAEVAGFSKFGSYTGNGSADGPFVFCGFKPRWLLIRASNGAAAWMIFDTARDTYNQHGVFLQAQSSAAEGSTGATDPIDTLSNGFKVRANGSGSVNASGGNYIYAAFAESPFKYSLAR